MRTSKDKLRKMVMVLALVLLVPATVLAENIDPDEDGSQYAYAENVSWINAEPLGNVGTGLEVGEFDVTGWMYGENIGWISFSCQNTSSCGTVSYGVAHDGGVLSGYAWTENAGWMSLSCENTGSCGTVTYGVVIDKATGEFSGRAWTENLGWVTFASAGPVVYRVKTAWTCTQPASFTTLELAPLGPDTELSWTAVAGVTAYDVMQGDLTLLLTSGGDFTAAGASCLADNVFATSTIQVGDPRPGEAFWFVVRGANCGGGTYDSGGANQVQTRDLEIEASGAQCP